MSVHLVGAALAALVIALPYLLHLYIQRLPVAPACPSCRAVTRASAWTWAVLQNLPQLSDTFVGECGRCGWRGRMRWKWATKPVQDGGDR